MSSDHEATGLITIAIADSTQIHTQLLADALHNDQGIHVVTSASNSADLLAAVTRVPIDVAVVSNSLDDQPARGSEVLREMRTLRPRIKGVILLESSRPQDILDCFRAGAKGVFCKKEKLESLSKCIRAVHEGQVWARSADLDVALEALAMAPVVSATNQKGLRLLSTRESQIVQCLASGMTNSQIAGKLGLSPHTIKNYLFRIFDKVGVSNRAELICLTMNSQPMPEACACGEPEKFSCVLEAAESGMLSAQLRMAEQLSEGNGHPRDDVSAYMWYLLAEKNLAAMRKKIEDGKVRVFGSMSPEQRTEALGRAQNLAKNGKKQATFPGTDLTCR